MRVEVTVKLDPKLTEVLKSVDGPVHVMLGRRFP